MDEILIRQNAVIIALLARQVFGDDGIRNIVTFRKKQKSKNYYNACNGRNSVNEIAKVIGVSAGTISPILKEWANQGIIYKMGTDSKPLYHRIQKIKKEK